MNSRRSLYPLIDTCASFGILEPGGITGKTQTELSKCLNNWPVFRSLGERAPTSPSFLSSSLIAYLHNLACWVGAVEPIGFLLPSGKTSCHGPLTLARIGAVKCFSSTCSTASGNDDKIDLLRLQRGVKVREDQSPSPGAQDPRSAWQGRPLRFILYRRPEENVDS